MKLRIRHWVLAGLAICVMMLCWAVLIEPRWVAQRAITLDVPRWQGPPGLKVAVASDWHFTKQPWRVVTIDRAKEIVEAINAARPDVVLLPGDFISDRDYRPEIAATAEDEIATVLGQIKAPLGVYAVLGNHDWWHGGAKFRAAFERQGIHVLENDVLPIAGTALWVVGIGDEYTGHARPAAAVAKLPKGAQALVLMHDPASLRELPLVRGLIVAGHTHGGQVALPWYGPLVLPTTAPREWAYGWVEHADNRMYVTSGIGVSVLPIRFNARPEWVMFTIGSPAP